MQFFSLNIYIYIKILRRFVFLFRTILYSHYIRGAILLSNGHCGKKIRCNGSIDVWIGKGGKISIGDHFRCNSSPYGRVDGSLSRIHIEKYGNLFIGDNTGITNVSIQCLDSIEIGSHVLIGANTLILDSDHHDINWKARMDGHDGCDTALSTPVKIGNNVFIGARCIINKGSIIGDRSVIAAGSVVVGKIPPDEIWGGNPAKYLKSIK